MLTRLGQQGVQLRQQRLDVLLLWGGREANDSAQLRQDRMLGGGFQITGLHRKPALVKRMLQADAGLPCPALTASSPMPLTISSFVLADQSMRGTGATSMPSTEGSSRP